MGSNPPEHGTKPRSTRHRHNHRVVRKQPPRPASDRHNIYITSKTDFKSQQRRCEELLNAGAREIFLHCMGFSVTRGLNLALRLVHNSEGALSYAINTSTVQLVDELHPLCDDEDVTFRQRNNSALHIKVFNRSLFDIVVPQPSQSQSQAQFRGKPKARQ
ncbi:ribonuclease P protein subunit p20 [Drosophila rhopaloa]|uniref:Ribonuclease P protein subunit p20 n=1 Tax=Drosophila rhopaloa TaxID=1041015 RepID=A0A6P4FKY6_DRORH|nr:ribonuclease P protein subunit p20 [Drosophila rhopaloa]